MEQLGKDNGPLPRKLSADNPGVSQEVPDGSEAAFRWAMNEDAMATEKLAEGIRLFAKDLAKLRAIVAARLER